MKKIVITLVLVFMLAVAVIPAAAAGNGPGGGGNSQPAPQATPLGIAVSTQLSTQQKSPRGTFTITGYISDIDIENNTVTVTVIKGNKLIQPYIDTDIVLTITTKTRFYYKTADSLFATRITFADLAIDDPVSVNGTVKDFVWTTTRITVGATLDCLP